MKKLWILFTLFIIGCNSASTPTPTLVPATSTKVSTPTLIPTPTVTPYPSLQTDGPYLLYGLDRINFVIQDANGIGKKELKLPNDGHVSELEKSVSPDGKWLAYFSGDNFQEPYDFTLHLLNIKDQTTEMISGLLASEFPENLKTVKTSDPVELENCISDECLVNLIQMAFNGGIESIAWSPDSKFLAFAAQIDGPSSDVYIYDVDKKTFRQLVSDLENVGAIYWSPNGEKIVFINTTIGVTYTTTYLYIADPNLKNVQTPNMIYGGKFWYRYGWINEKTFLFSDGGEGAPAQNFRSLNVITQEIRTIWPYEVENLTVDNQNHRMIFSTPTRAENQPQGTFVINDNGSYKKISDNFYDIFEKQDSSEMYFGLEKLSESSRAESAELVIISMEKQIFETTVRIPFYHAQPRLSPDENWILLYSTSGVELYSNQFELIKLWDDIKEVGEIVWVPDSSGAYIITRRGDIYYLSLQNKNVTMVNQFSNYYPFDYLWLP